MTFYRLADHVGVCQVDGRTLMLDLRRDRYFQLDPRWASALRQSLDGVSDEAARTSLHQLLERGLIVPRLCADSARSCIAAVPSWSLLGSVRPSAVWRRIPEVAATLGLTRWRLHQRGLEGAVEHVRRRKPRHGLGDPAGPVARFRAARTLVPVAPNCLTDSLGLAAFLSRRAVAWQLVFGVKLDPFAAHCWLQSDEAILNDAADTVANFTPIMVI